MQLTVNKAAMDGAHLNIDDNNPISHLSQDALHKEYLHINICIMPINNDDEVNNNHIMTIAALHNPKILYKLHLVPAYDLAIPISSNTTKIHAMTRTWSLQLHVINIGFCNNKPQLSPNTFSNGEFTLVDMLTTTPMTMCGHSMDHIILTSTSISLASPL